MGTGIGGTTATITNQLETPTIHGGVGGGMKSKQNGLFTPFFLSFIPATLCGWEGLDWLERKLTGWPMFVAEGRQR